MSADVALSSKLPADEETNGLDALHESLTTNPDQVVCGIVWFDVPKITIDTESGKERPTVRVRRIEPIGTVDKVPAAVMKLALDLQQKRTGRTPLPFDQIDTKTGHVEIVKPED